MFNYNSYSEIQDGRLMLQDLPVRLDQEKLDLSTITEWTPVFVEFIYDTEIRFTNSKPVS